MAREAIHTIEQSDVLFRETFNSVFDVRRNGGDPDAGATSPTFFSGMATFDGVTAEITYSRDRCRFSEPEKAFSIRTRVYLTDVDASVFIQLYDNGAPPHQEFRFLICGIWPNAGDVDKLSLELWDDTGTNAVREMRGRKYNTSLVSTALNTWKEFVCTYDGRAGVAPQDGICLYIDGVRVDDTDVVLDNGGDYQAMEYNSTLLFQVGRNVQGKMDILEIYNRVLTPEEVANMAGV